MSDIFPSLLTEAHKPDLLSGTNVLPYAGSGTGSSIETGSMPGGSGRSLDAMPFPGGITTDTNRQLDTVQARSATTEQLAARMASSVPLSHTETAADKTGNPYIPTSPAGSAVASLPWMNLSGTSGSNAATDVTTGLPKLQFISHENALLNGASRNESAYNGVPKLDENGLEVTQPSSPSKHLAQFRTLALYASSQSAAYDHSVYGDASNAGMGSWGTGGAGGMIGGGGLTPGQAAEYAVRVWMGKGPEWVQQILGVTLPPQTMEDFARVIEGAVHKHGESPAESIQRQRYNIASSEHGEQVRNAISREFYDRNLTPAENKALAVQLADGTKTLAQFRREAAYSDVARHKIADIFRQEHGFDATQQDLDYASMKTGDGWSLQDYRWSEAHSDRVTSKLKDIITAVQGRPVNANDDVWIQAQQDSLGNGQQSIDQVRQSLARWTADNGGYDATFQQVHGRAAGAADRDYAAKMIGNGWSVADYRWSEAHSAGAAHEYIGMFHNLTGYNGNADEIAFLQDKVGHGSSYDDARRDLAYSSYGHDAVQRVYARTAGIQNPEQFQYDCYQEQLANNASIADITRNIAHAWEGRNAVQAVYARTAGIQNPEQFQYDCYQEQLANNASIADITRNIAHAWEGRNAVQAVYARTAGIQNPEQFQYDCYQEQLANNASIADITRNIAHAWEGRNAVQAVYARTAGIQNPEQFQYDCYQEQLANNASIADITRNIAHAWEGRNAVDNLAHSILNRNLSNDERTQYQNELAGGVYINTLKSLMLSTPTIFTASTGGEILRALHTANTDLSAVQRAIDNWGIIENSARKYNIDPAMLAAISIRETGFKNVSEVGGGDGRGYFQIDIGENSNVTEKQAFDLNFSSDFAAKMLSDNRYKLAAKFPSLDKAHLDQATVASYNFGIGNISGNPNTIDVGTTGGNYGSNVMTIMKAFSVVLH